MQEGKDAQVKTAIISEIEALQRYYATLREYVAGKPYDSTKMMAMLQVFKDGLNRISAHILTLYVLNKQKTKITWQQLLENLDNATATVQASPKRDPRSAIELAFNMGQPNAQEVMVYLAKLKESLK
jgi:TPP-dependent pyruvate/acetoin dehydrogenase alpha subunit